MAFSKTFPKTVPGSNYPVWEEVFLTEEEENQVEADCKRTNFRILDESIQEAKALAIKHSMNTEEIVSNLAIALFEKRASHEVFWKENKAKEKFDHKNRQ
ncbi:MAG: hypothetical protein ABIH82_02095 [Candidatus Woesearchaeota archaeon]